MSTEATCKIGMAQIRVEGGDPNANLARAVEFVAKAALAGCEAVVLPECMDLGWTDPTARELAEPIPGTRTELLAESAREHGIYVVSGLVERDGADLYNAAVMIDPQGEIVLRHRKIVEVGDGADLYSTGSELAVAKTPMGVVGIPICADNLEPKLGIGSALGLMGAELLLSPSAWAVPVDFDQEATPYGMEWVYSYGRLAREHGLATVGVTYVGRLQGDGDWSGRPVIGRSLAMGANGQIAAWAEFGEDAEELLIAEVPVQRRGPVRRRQSRRGWSLQ